MAEIYVIGVDAEPSMRAGVFDLTGAVIAEGVTPITTRFPKPAGPNKARRNGGRPTGSSVRQAVSNAKIRPDQIVGLAADTTCYRRSP